MTNRDPKPPLSLRRETLVRLTPEHLEHVVGGFTDIRISGSCCLWGSCRTSAPPPPSK
jgi:hypothetical protein